MTAKPERGAADVAPKYDSIVARLERVSLFDAVGQKPRAKPSDLRHRNFTDDTFWQRLKAYRNISREEFNSHTYQTRNSVTKIDDLFDVIGDYVDESFIADVDRGMKQAPMLIRLSPYVLSLVDWNDPYHDPIRRQFIPVASTREPDHPMSVFDSLAEQDDSPVPGLVHRYDDKVLFLALDVCPVYCRFCTRSYSIGGDTDLVEKENFKPIPKNWDNVFAYLLSRAEVEDVVVSGGDAYFLSSTHLETIGTTLLAIPHIKRIRFATKGPAVMPMKILSDKAWTDTLISLAQEGRKLGKDVCLHTHFNHANEITDITRRAMTYLYKSGVTVRNQSVCIRGVNDSGPAMTELVKKLSAINVQPYYVYQHDMVRGVEDLRTRIQKTSEVEKSVRGVTAGFNTPTFVTDAPGGGGKRAIHSYEYYDEETGVAVYRSPSVDADKVYLYFDPVSKLPEEGQRRWSDENLHEDIISEALNSAGCSHLVIANSPVSTI